MTALRAREGIAARALEFTILTAARTKEVLGATWSEINLTEATWTIAGIRMKGGREHRVALSVPIAWRRAPFEVNYIGCWPASSLKGTNTKEIASLALFRTRNTSHHRQLLSIWRIWMRT